MKAKDLVPGAVYRCILNRIGPGSPYYSLSYNSRYNTRQLHPDSDVTIVMASIYSSFEPEHAGDNDLTGELLLHVKNLIFFHAASAKLIRISEDELIFLEPL